MAIMHVRRLNDVLSRANWPVLYVTDIKTDVAIILEMLEDASNS